MTDIVDRAFISLKLCCCVGLIFGSERKSCKNCNIKKDEFSTWSSNRLQQEQIEFYEAWSQTGQTRGPSWTSCWGSFSAISSSESGSESSNSISNMDWFGGMLAPPLLCSVSEVISGLPIGVWNRKFVILTIRQFADDTDKIKPTQQYSFSDMKARSTISVILRNRESTFFQVNRKKMGCAFFFAGDCR